MIAEPNLKALIALTKNGVSSTCIGDGVPTDDIDCTQAALMSFSTDAINLHRSRIKILMELGTLSLIVGSSIIAFPDHKCIRSKKQQWKVYFYWVLDTRTCAKHPRSCFGYPTAPLVFAMSGVAQDYGTILLGGLLASGLSGCVNMQFIVYWRLYSYESWRAKSLVIVIWLLDLCHSAFVAVALWDSIIVPYGDMDEFDKIPWSVGPAVELTAMITFLVQSVFAYRIYRLQKKRLTIVIPIVALAFFRLVAASVSMSEMIRLRSYAAFVQHPFPHWIFTVGLSLSASVDIMITAIMCYFLRKNRTKVTSTMRIIDTLTLWTIRNGSMTSAAAIASLICWLAMPDNRTFLGLHFVIAKLYANSLLATLNARQHIRNGNQYSSSSDRPLPIVFSEDWENAPEALHLQHGFSMRLDPYMQRREHTKRGQTIQVNVERVVESKLDDAALEPTESHTEGSTV